MRRIQASYVYVRYDWIRAHEEYLGAGALTRSLLALPPTRLKKLIVLEDNPVFFDHLKVLIPFLHEVYGSNCHR